MTKENPVFVGPILFARFLNRWRVLLKRESMACYLGKNSSEDRRLGIDIPKDKEKDPHEKGTFSRIMKLSSPQEIFVAEALSRYGARACAEYCPVVMEASSRSIWLSQWKNWLLRLMAGSIMERLLGPSETTA